MCGSALLAALAFATALAPQDAHATTTVDVPPDRSRVEALASALRDEAQRALEPAASGRLVVRVRTDLAPEAPRPSELAIAIVEPTLAALREDADRFSVVHLAVFAGDGEEAAARAARLGYDALLDVSLRATGNFLAVEGSAWASTERGGSFDLRSRLDAELRTYAGRLPRVTEETVVARVASLPARDYLAMAASDLDGDGTTELVLITERAISIARLGAARVGVRVEEVLRAPLPSSIPTAPSRTRRVLASAVPHDGAIVARLSSLAAPIRIALSNGALEITRASGPCADAAFPFDAGCAELIAGRDFFDDAIAPPEGSPFHTPGTFYSHASRRLRGAADVLDYEAVITPQGRLAVRVGQRSTGALGYGTALAMADLDEDGAAELLVSSSAPTGGGDQLSLLRVLPRGALHVLWRSEPIAGSIWIADDADLDGDGLDELLAIEEPSTAAGAARLWIVR